MAEQVAGRERTHGADGIDEERMGAVEGEYISAAIRRAGPSCRLDRAGTFQGKFVETPLPPIFRYSAFVHEAQQVAVSADVVEAVIVHADVADVTRHERDGGLAGELKEFGFARGVVSERGGAELKALGPLGPAAAGIPSADGEYGRAGGGSGGTGDGSDLRLRGVEEFLHRRSERSDGEVVGDGHLSAYGLTKERIISNDRRAPHAALAATVSANCSTKRFKPCQSV